MPGRLVTNQQVAFYGLDEEKRAIVDSVEAKLQETVPDGVSIKELQGESGKLPTIASKVVSGVDISTVVDAYTKSADARSGSYSVSMVSDYVFMVDASVIGNTVIQDEEYISAIAVIRSVSETL